MFCCSSTSFVSQAKAVFGCLGALVITGRHFLGGYIGDVEQRQDFVLQKVLAGVLSPHWDAAS